MKPAADHTHTTDLLPPARLEQLAESARNHARGAKAAHTLRAYAADWRDYITWCARHGLPPLPPDPPVIGLYLAACAADTGSGSARRRTAATIERRLSGLAWNFNQRGQAMDRSDRHITEVLAGIRRKHGRPPVQKDAVSTEELIAMVATLGHDLRGLRDRAMLLLGFAGGFRRSELVGLDCGRDQTGDGVGWVETLEGGALVTLHGKTGWREVEIGRGSSESTCPVVALEVWLRLGRISHGPLFRRVSRDGKRVATDRLTDKHVARLVQRTALGAGVRADLPEGDRRQRFAGHSLRTGLAAAAELDERYVQRHLGRDGAEMTRPYQQRRDRFRVNLTKAAGL